MTSPHQLAIVYSTPMVPMPNTIGAPENILCIQAIAPKAMMKAETEPTNGQGLGSTRW